MKKSVVKREYLGFILLHLRTRSVSFAAALDKSLARMDKVRLHSSY